MKAAAITNITHLVKYLLLFTCLEVYASSKVLFAQGVPKPLAIFQFDGNANDSTGNIGNKVCFNDQPKFKGDALYHDGEYGRGNEVPSCHTPYIDFNAFTVAIRFKAASFTDENIIAGGRGSRWISFRAHKDGENPSRNLQITFNNQDFEYEYPVKVETEKWYSLVCGVDLKKRTVTTYLNGDRLPSLRLPEDFKLRVANRDLTYQADEKRWCLANYSNGQTFHGLIDELAVFHGDVAFKVAKDYSVDPLLLKVLRRRRVENSNVVIDEIEEESKRFQQDLGRLEKQLNAMGIQTTREGIIRCITGNSIDEEQDKLIANLIQQFKNDSFGKREAASMQLRILGNRARKDLSSAMSSNNPEIAWRSAQLLKDLESQTTFTPPIIYALDYLRAKPSPKAVPALFASIDDDVTTEQFVRVCAALARCARPDNQGQIMNSLKSINPRVRFAGIIATDRVFDSKPKEKILRTYLSDEDTRVRLAAAAMLRDQSEAASEVLANLQSSQSFTTRYLAKLLREAERH